MFSYETLVTWDNKHLGEQATCFELLENFEYLKYNFFHKLQLNCVDLS